MDLLCLKLKAVAAYLHVENQTNGRKTSTVYSLLKATLPWRLGIDTICFFLQHIMLLIMLFFFAQIMLKNMLFALHYAKLF